MLGFSLRMDSAINSPLLEEGSIEGARGIIINITAGNNLTLYEVHQACELVHQSAHQEANIIFGAMIDESIKDEVKVTVIATGFETPAASEAPTVKTFAPNKTEATPGHPQENVSF